MADPLLLANQELLLVGTKVLEGYRGVVLICKEKASFPTYESGSHSNFVGSTSCSVGPGTESKNFVC